MSHTTIEPTIKSMTVTIERLPLAVYREMAAHLRQVGGVTTELLPQRASNFDYLQSQVGGLKLTYGATDSISSIESKVTSILRYYEHKYGSKIN